MPIRAFTTGDKPLDVALNALVSAAHYDTASSMKLADDLETKYFEFQTGFKYYLKQLRGELEGAADNQEHGFASANIGIDNAIIELWRYLATFDSDCRAILTEMHIERAAVVEQSIGVEQKLIQTIAAYAIRRGLAQSPINKPSPSHLETTKKYTADMKTCAADSKTAPSQ